MARLPSITYPAGGDPIWTESGVAADLIRKEFFGAEPAPGGDVAGTLAATLPACSLVAAGTAALLGIAGALSAPLPAPSLSASGGPAVAAALASALAPPALSALGQAFVVGELAADMPGPILAAEGINGEDAPSAALGGGGKARWVFRRAWEVDDGRKVRRYATPEDAAKAVERIADAEPIAIGLMAPPRPVQVRYDGAPVALPRTKTAGWAEIAQRLEVAERAHKRRRQEDDELALMLLITRAWGR